MSLTKKLWMSLSLVGISVGAGLSWWASTRSTPSNLVHDLKPKLGFASARVQMGKPNRSLTVRIENLDDIPTDNESEIRLQLTVSAQQALESNVTVNWILPEGIELIAEPTSTLTAITPDTPFVREVRVRGLNQQNLAVIRVDAYAVLNHQPITTQGVFASHPLGSDLERHERPSLQSGRSIGSQKLGDSSSTANGAQNSAQDVLQVRMPARIHF